ncbi:MAG: hypothetical protein HY832_01090 [Candidatus Aenigmarchaeota archaeon]|nr:hypothetical protein [Candidatus Aenigmarchaeota archaeon]
MGLRLRGWLTHEDVNKLEEASKRVYKYEKKPSKQFKCASCSYLWFYEAMKCPICACQDIKKVR